MEERARTSASVKKQGRPLKSGASETVGLSRNTYRFGIVTNDDRP